MQLDPDTLDRAAAYRLMISAIVPRPVAWIGSVRADGTDNLAPFSYFMGVASAPPMLAVSVARGPKGSLKHTAQGLLETGELTVSIPEEAELDAMHRSSAPFAESEFDAVPVGRRPGVKVRAPRPATSRVSMECRVAHTLDLGQTHLFVAEVVLFHIDDALYVDGLVDITAFRPVARLGGEGYTTLGGLLTRPPARL
jgi:flavin reductase (DIM6/NTAB) family NADH-FMN oxidoreductase RutF